MTIKAIRGPRGEEQAFCTCDDCNREKTIPARHGDSRRFIKGGAPVVTLHSEAHVIDALKDLGWSHIKNRLRCPACTKARSDKPKEVTVTTTAELTRQPTQAQEVDIIVALSSVYDRKAKRYAGTETDRTVAEVIGGGCMPGWVARIRSEKFGPAGNEEAEAIRAEIETVRADLIKRLDALSIRLTNLYAAEDKRIKA